MIDFESNFWAAVIGAVVGGAISLILQLVANRNSRKERIEAKQEADRSLAYSLSFKIVKIVNRLGNINKHVDECKKLVEGEKGEPLAWTFLLPILNMPDEIHLNADEMALLFSTKNDDLFNSVLNIEPIYNSILPVWTEYKGMRERFSAYAEQKIVSTGVSEARFDVSGQGGIMLFEVNSLAENLIDRAQKDYAEAREILRLLLKHFNSTQRLAISFDVGSDPSLPAPIDRNPSSSSAS